MSIDINSPTIGRVVKPPRTFLYGPPKIGKSTFGSQAPNPIFMDVEGGIDFIDTASVRIHTFEDAMDMVSQLDQMEHSYKTLVIDSADWLERLIFDYTAKKEGRQNIEEIPYGKGYSLALDRWKTFLRMLDDLRKNKNMSIIFLGHSEVKKHNDPMSAEYDVYVPKLHGKTTKGDCSLSILTEWSDTVLFANYKVWVTKEAQGFKVVSKGKGSGERVLHTAERPAFKAGNRYGLPDELDFSYEAYSIALRESYASKNN